MTALYPLTFHPIFKERIWGGRSLEQLYSKALPPRVPIGESWEISDHGQDISVIANGPLAGKTLRWLMENFSSEILGKTTAPRFPLLIKILDAQEKLSLQVHPPARIAAELGGEPKTEMWYITHAAPDAELYVGLKAGVTRHEFEHKIQTGEVAECFHRIRVQAGDAIFLPSGRVHAIGAGLVIFEVQQNSDTTYRVFDWNRVGLDGKPRELHIGPSLASIDFQDFEPSLISRRFDSAGPIKVRPLVHDPLFTINACECESGTRETFEDKVMRIFSVLEGRLTVSDGKTHVVLAPGQFCLAPACLKPIVLKAETETRFLEIKVGHSV